MSDVPAGQICAHPVGMHAPGLPHLCEQPVATFGGLCPWRRDDCPLATTSTKEEA